MFSRLFVALFVFFALSVFSSPIPCDPAHSTPPPPSPTDGCSDHAPSCSPTSTPSSPPPYQPTPTTSPSSAPSPASTPAPPSSDTSDLTTGGIATYFYQGGNAGACGNVNPDSALICAIDSARFNMGICGKQVQITNTDNGQTITVTVADECPTCNNGNSIDLSVGAFSALSNGNLGEGIFNIAWKFLD